MRWMCLLIGLLGLTFAGAASRVPLPYPDQPLPGHTGGFGEPTCHTCHFDQPLNAPDGVLTLRGVPEVYAPGQTYRITVELVRADMGRGGFQLASRIAEGDGAGQQAGTLQPTDDQRTAVTATDSIQYVHHTPEGTALAASDTIRWAVEWTAPAQADAPVAFHTAANAANNDESAFGDFIYTQHATSQPTNE